VIVWIEPYDFCRKLVVLCLVDGIVIILSTMRLYEKATKIPTADKRTILLGINESTKAAASMKAGNTPIK
jgi:hypothetical protein